MEHNRRKFIKITALSFLSTQLYARPSKNKPNIIVIFSDDHGYPDIGGQDILKDVTAPHMKELVENGVLMTDGYVTAPQCVPSRAGLLTGQYQPKFGLEANKGNMDGFNKAKKFPQYLQDAGYVTGMAGKWHLGQANEVKTHGFDHVYFRKGERPAWANIDLDGNDVEGGNYPSNIYHLDACSQVCASFIKRYADKPFMFYLAYRAPHVPLDPTDKYLKRFPGKMPERRRKALAMISAMDDGVGLIMKTLRKHKIEENTLIFYIGDNGAPLKIHKLDAPGIGPGWDGSLNDPLNGEKGMLSEGGIRTPFFMYWKGTLPAGLKYKHPVISLDVAATAISLSGQIVPKEMDGVNLIPYLTGKNKKEPHEVLYWRWVNQAAIRKGEWKYLQAHEHRYLFNMKNDKEEKNNLLKKHPEMVESLYEQLEKWTKTLTPPGIHVKRLEATGQAFYDHYLNNKPQTAPVPTKKKSNKKKNTSIKNKKKKETEKTSQKPKNLFTSRDTNKDGKVTLEEFLLRPGRPGEAALKRRFEKYDKNKDGFWTKDEIK